MRVDPFLPPDERDDNDIDDIDDDDERLFPFFLKVDRFLFTFDEFNDVFKFPIFDSE